MNNPYYLKDTNGNYYNQYPEFQVWEDGKKAGIKEVVDWVNHCISMTSLDYKEWKAQLKKWGIEGVQK